MPTVTAQIDYADIDRLTRRMSPYDRSTWIWEKTDTKRPYPKGDKTMVVSLSRPGHEHAVRDHFDPIKGRLIFTCPCPATGECWHQHHAERAFFFGGGFGYEATTGDSIHNLQVA